MEFELHQDTELSNTNTSSTQKDNQNAQSYTRSTQTDYQHTPSDIVEVIKNVCSKNRIEIEATDVDLYPMSTKLTDMAIEQIIRIIEIALGNGTLLKVQTAKVILKLMPVYILTLS